MALSVRRPSTTVYNYIGKLTIRFALIVRTNLDAICLYYEAKCYSEIAFTKLHVLLALAVTSAP